MYDQILAITGTGDITYENASALLADIVKPKTFVLIAYDVVSEGLKNVSKLVSDCGMPSEDCKESDIFYILDNMESEDKRILVLEKTELKYNENSYRVYDLSHGLFMIYEPTGASRMALHGSQIDADRLEPTIDNTLSVHDPKTLRGSERSVIIPGNIAKLLSDEEIIKILTAHISIKEENWNSVPEPKNEPETAEKIKYYKSKTGKMRPAGRSKARPGETEVFLTKEEVAKL